MSSTLGGQCLSSFSAIASSLIGEGGFETLKKGLAEKKLPLAYPLELKKTQEDLASLSALLNKLSAIVYRPHLANESEDVVLRNEQAGSLSEEGIRRTIRDTSLWKRKGSSMKPEYVHSLENTDEVVTYENRFICRLLEEATQESEDLLRSYAPFERNLRKAFDGAPSSYSAFGLYGDLEECEHGAEGLLLDEENEESALASALRKTYRKCLTLKASDFYRLVSKHPFSGELIPTNVLLHDPQYNYAYRYYRKHYSSKDAESSYEDLYRNYALTRLFLALETLDPSIKPQIRWADGRLLFEPFLSKVGSFAYSWAPEEETKGVLLGISWAGQPEVQAQYALVSVLALDEESRLRIKSGLGRRFPALAGVRFLTAFNHSGHPEGSLDLSPFGKKEDTEAALGRFLKSFGTLLSGVSRLYEAKCPVCGEETVYQSHGLYKCAHCGSSYALGHEDKKETVWLIDVEEPTL